MPPRRRKAASSGAPSTRTAAIQAVRNRQMSSEASTSTMPTDNTTSHLPTDTDICPAMDSSHSQPKTIDTTYSMTSKSLSQGIYHSGPDTETEDAGCLHCHRPNLPIQVRCDECQSYICEGCHWCHEYQANHEIRVCDRCDAFYCRNCDEMDQCDDCGEVVCASCSTLLSCKFCGGGLCEECATACGRCGIVLCSRDAKFAVDCDTCRLSYCLVCLASGSKDPCVRCGHRPSKRMEQLVHLRLKSIYKAFKQSNQNPNISNHAMKSMEEHNISIEALNKNALASNNHRQHVPQCLPKDAHAILKNPSLVDPSLVDDWKDDDLEDESALTTAAVSDGDEDDPLMAAVAGFNSAKIPGDFMIDRFMEEKQKEADAAAEALLAELEEEEEAAKTKKSKKKRKKERQQKAKRKEKEGKDPEASTPSTQVEPPLPSEEATEPRDVASSPNKVDAQPSRQKEDLPDAVQKEPEPVEAVSPPSVTPETSHIDPIEKKLCEFVDEGNVEGIEAILFELKGVPGRAALRKNAKKALKRIRSNPQEQEKCEEETPPYTNDLPQLLKMVSDNNVPGKQPNRAECVMQMSPLVVGWVIGKGGQRIRDLMEESGAKVWIDQEKAKPEEPRNVYISGDRTSVDLAVRMVHETVSQAPIEGATSYAPEPLPKEDVEPPIFESRAAVPRPEPEHPVETTPDMPVMPRKTEPTDTHESEGVLHPAEADVDEVQVEHTMTCETRFVPLLIGKRGWAIKDIQDKSGARVDIDQTVTPRQIRISGTRSCVDKAIPMVGDVLSYPHAQPHPLQATEAGPALQTGLPPNENPQLLGMGDALPQHDAPAHDMVAELAERPHTPPPASLIMTGDAKSMISASSSLSTTPEPSLSSNPAWRQHVNVAPQLPSYGATNNLPGGGGFLPRELQGGIGARDLQGGMGGGAGGLPPAMYGNSGLMGLQQIPGMQMPPPPNNQPMYGHPPAKFSSPRPGGGPAPGMGMGANGNLTSGPMPLPQPNSLLSPGPQPMAQFGPMQSPPLPNILPGGDGPGGASAFESRSPQRHGGLWNHAGQFPQDTSNMPHAPPMNPGTMLAPPSTGGPPPVSQIHPMGGVQYLNRDGAQTGATGTMSQLDGFGMGPAPTGQPSFAAPNPGTAAATNVLQSVRDDSRIIDSLFGPATAAPASVPPISEDPTQGLLPAFNGLSVGTSAVGVEGGGNSGLWGGPLPEWSNTQPAAAPTIKAKEAALESSILAGLQAPLQSSFDAQHPRESRFNWSSTNA